MNTELTGSKSWSNKPFPFNNILLLFLLYIPAIILFAIIATSDGGMWANIIPLSMLVLSLTPLMLWGLFKFLSASDLTIFTIFVFLLPFSARLPIEGFPFTLTAILLYGLIARHLLIHHKIRVVRSNLIWLSILFIGIGLLTAFTGVALGNSLRKLYNVMNAILVFWATTHFLRSSEHIQRVVRALIISGFVFSLIGITQVGAATLLGPGLEGASKVIEWNKTIWLIFEGQAILNRIPDWSIWWRTGNWFADSFNSLRATGTTWSPMSYAQILMFSFFPLLALTLSAPKSRKRGWMLALVFIQLAAIIVTLSRGAWFALVVGGSVLGYYFLLGRLRISRKVLLRMLMVSVLVAVTIIAFAPSSLKETAIAAVMSVIQPAQSDVRQFDASNDSRFYTYSVGLRIVQERWLLGIGPGNYALYLNGEDGATTHNLYLDVAAEMGIFGFLVYLLIFVTNFHNFAYTARRNTDPYLKALATGFNATNIALAFYWMFTSYFFEPKINMMLWLTIGIGVVIKLLTQQSLQTQRLPQ